MGGRAGAGKGVEDDGVGVCGNLQDTFNQAGGFGGVEGGPPIKY